MRNASLRRRHADLQCLHQRELRKWLKTAQLEALEQRRLLSAAGDLDPTFAAGGVNIDTSMRTGEAVDVGVQSDGKLVTLEYHVDSKQALFEVVRYTANGR